MTPLELLTAAHNLPDDVREQLSAVRTTSFMIDLNSRLNIKAEKQRIIPGLVLRLVARDLAPQDFLSELAIQLNISDSSAKIIVKEIEEKVLHPIEDSLREKAEVDVVLLHFGKEVSGELPKVASAPSAEAAMPAATEKPRPVIDTERHIEAKSMAPTAKPAVPSGPFILHSEKDEIKPAAEAQKSRPTFSIKIPITQKKYYSAAPAVRARIEMPEGEGHESQVISNKSQAGGFGTPIAPPLRKLSEMAMAAPTNPGIMNNELGIKENAGKTEDPAQSGRGERLAPPGAGLKIENGAVKMVQPKIQKVVHYSDFFTKL